MLAVTSKTWFPVFSLMRISPVDTAHVRLGGYSGVEAGCYVVNILVSTFHHQGYLPSLVKIQPLFCQYTSADMVICNTYNQQVPQHILDSGTKFAKL